MEGKVSHSELEMEMELQSVQGVSASPGIPGIGYTGCCDWSTVYWRWRERANMLHMREAAAKVLVLVILLWIYGKHV